MKKDSTAELKIKEAAKRVFIAKGFDGCSSREIAKEAGMNVALVNYYFCSKGKLFELIFQSVMEDFMVSMLDVFVTDLSLESKIKIFIEREFEFLTKHPEIPGFIINELTRKGGMRDMDPMGIIEKINDTGIFKACQEAQEKGEMKRIDIVSMTILIAGNCQFPFMAQPLMQQIHSITDEQYQQQLVIHKQYVTEMIINFLFPKK